MVAMTSICRNNPLPKGTLQRVKGNLDSLAFTWEQRKVGELLVERNEQASMSEEYPLIEYVGRILHPAAAVFYSCGGEI
jgi:hypothetical protein